MTRHRKEIRAILDLPVFNPTSHVHPGLPSTFAHSSLILYHCLDSDSLSGSAHVFYCLKVIHGLVHGIHFRTGRSFSTLIRVPW
jgi:hypothetical protein